jgi:hypothetical protein
MHMRWLEVCGCEHLLCPNRHPPPIFNLWKKLHFSFLFFLSEGNHGPRHAWATWAFLSSYLCYSCSSLALKGCVWIISSFVNVFGHVLVVPSLKLFLMVPICTKSQEFVSFSPNFVVIACVLAI